MGTQQVAELLPSMGGVPPKVVTDVYDSVPLLYYPKRKRFIIG